MSKILIASTEENLNSKWSFGSAAIKVSQLATLPPIKSTRTTAPLKIVSAIKTKSYPPLSERKSKVNNLEEKLMVDWIRQFDGLAEAQRDVLIKLIDKNAELRKQVNLGPGICEKLDDPYLGPEQDLDKSQETNINSSEAPVSIRIDDGYESQELIQSEAPSDIDLFYLNYPLQNYKIIGNHLLDDGLTGWKKEQTKGDIAKHLRQKYGRFIENKGSQQSLSNDLELEAMTAMKMVSADLQSWVVNVLDNSITMDPSIIQQVNEMDEKAGMDPEKQKGPPIPEIDITGFNVLLNACKPAILEARPPMRLNIVKEVGRSESIPQNHEYPSMHNRNAKSGSKAKNQYGAWYLPINQWNMKKGKEEAEQLSKRRHVFGGIVQQKLDDITKKRETDMKSLMKENGEGLDRKKRNK